MSVILALFLAQTLVFANYERWQMVFFSVAGMCSYFLSSPEIMNPFTSTLLCVGVCLVTAYLVHKNKTKDTLCQLVLLILILPCLGMLLFDQVKGTDTIFTNYTQIFTGIQLLQILSLNGKINAFINRFVLDIVSDYDHRSNNYNSDSGGTSC